MVMGKAKSKVRERVFTVVFMAAVTFVCISIVSAIHLASAEAVERNAALYLKQGVVSAAGVGVPTDGDALLAWYAQHVAEQTGSDGTPVYAVDGAGYVFVRSGAGLWGTITAAIGMDRALEQFTGVAFISQNETPGLGARITEPWFCEQVAGKTGGLTLVPEGTQAPEPHKLDAITGATITSTAVCDMLNALAKEAKGMLRTP